MRPLVLVALLLAACPLHAKDASEAEVEDHRAPYGYFVGAYERLGRDAQGGLLNDTVFLELSETGLSLTNCAGEIEAALAYDNFFGEIGNLLSAPQAAGEGLLCIYANDPNNYPLLNCTSGDQRLRYALWASPEARCTRP